MQGVPRNQGRWAEEILADLKDVKLTTLQAGQTRTVYYQRGLRKQSKWISKQGYYLSCSYLLLSDAVLSNWAFKRLRSHREKKKHMETSLFQQSKSENPNQTCKNVTFWTARQSTLSRLLALWNPQSSSLEVQLRWKTPYCKSFSIYITIEYTIFDRNLLYRTDPLEVLSWLSLSACFTEMF